MAWCSSDQSGFHRPPEKRAWIIADSRPGTENCRRGATCKRIGGHGVQSANGRVEFPQRRTASGSFSTWIRKRRPVHAQEPRGPGRDSALHLARHKPGRPKKGHQSTHGNRSIILVNAVPLAEKAWRSPAPTCSLHGCRFSTSQWTVVATSCKETRVRVEGDWGNGAF